LDNFKKNKLPNIHIVDRYFETVQSLGVKNDSKGLDYFINEKDEMQRGIVVKNCGDVMKLQIEVEDGIIKDAKFKTYGCGSAIASSSLVTEWLKGKNLDEAQAIKNSDIATELALPPVKIHCSILAEDAIRAAINNYKEKNDNINCKCN
jgi:nitrogen fixation NifU-like protein